jgi:hypothetical protein
MVRIPAKTRFTRPGFLSKLKPPCEGKYRDGLVERAMKGGKHPKLRGTK